MGITIYSNRNKSHDNKNNIFELRLKNRAGWDITSLLYLSYTFQLKWVRLHQNTANFLVITIYDIRVRSHDQINNIFELSLKNGSDWYIILLVFMHFCLIPILEILCRGPNYEWINEWMNQWKKSLSSGMIKNES